jgi:hypothetical protein
VECSRIVLARTEDMAKREEQYYGRGLFINLAGDVRVTPEVLVASLEQHFAVSELTSFSTKMLSPNNP